MNSRGEIPIGSGAIRLHGTGVRNRTKVGNRQSEFRESWGQGTQDTWSREITRRN
jgi:hypothetical protein